MITEELRPCPFCANRDLELGGFPGYAPVAGRVFVHCSKCHTSGPLSQRFEDEEEAARDAVKLWNKRPRGRRSDNGESKID